MIAVVGMLAALALPSVALASAPQFDTGVQMDTQNPYLNAQEITDVFTSKAVYGKLEGATPVDIYSFTPDKDGNQTFSILAPSTTPADAQLTMVFVDSTTATQDAGLNLPTPTGYHSLLVTPVKDPQTFNEPVLFEQFNVYAQGNFSLQKGKTYYLIVLDQSSKVDSYAIKLGTDKSWGASDIITHFGGWLRVKTDSFSGTSPFTFKPVTVGMLLFLLGFAVLLGMWFIEQLFSFLSNRMKMAGYILIKMQPYSRVITWVSLWFTLLGGYIYFGKVGWNGLPFVIGFAFVIIAIVQLLYTLILSRRIGVLEVSKQEATIPRDISTWLYAYFVVTLLGFGSFITLFSIYLAH